MVQSVESVPREEKCLARRIFETSRLQTASESEVDMDEESGESIDEDL